MCVSAGLCSWCVCVWPCRGREEWGSNLEYANAGLCSWCVHFRSCRGRAIWFPVAHRIYISLSAHQNFTTGPPGRGREGWGSNIEYVSVGSCSGACAYWCVLANQNWKRSISVLACVIKQWIRVVMLWLISLGKSLLTAVTSFRNCCRVLMKWHFYFCHSSWLWCCCTFDEGHAPSIYDRMPGYNYRSRFMSLLLCSCDVFQSLISSLCLLIFMPLLLCYSCVHFYTVFDIDLFYLYPILYILWTMLWISTNWLTPSLMNACVGCMFQVSPTEMKVWMIWWRVLNHVQPLIQKLQETLLVENIVSRKETSKYSNFPAWW